MKSTLLTALVLILSASFLVSCDTITSLRTGMFYVEGIPVDDFSGYSENGAIDESLVGSWRNAQSGDIDIGPDELRIKGDKAHYQLDNYFYKYGSYRTGRAVTIKAGNYCFLYVSKEHRLFRYKIKNGILTKYGLKSGPALGWLKENYPRAKNIGVGDYGDADPGTTKMTFVKIKSFDPETQEILSKIPDSDMFWSTEQQFKKWPPTPEIPGQLQ